MLSKKVIELLKKIQRNNVDRQNIYKRRSKAGRAGIVDSGNKRPDGWIIWEHRPFLASEHRELNRIKALRKPLFIELKKELKKIDAVIVWGVSGQIKRIDSREITD